MSPAVLLQQEQILRERARLCFSMGLLASGRQLVMKANWYRDRALYQTVQTRAS